MDPVTIATLIGPALTAAAKLLTDRARKEIGKEAVTISQTAPESQERVRAIFNRTKWSFKKVF